MQIQDVTVKSNEQISEGTFLIEVVPNVPFSRLEPGQFFNIQVSENLYPLLRRPFSICDVDGDSVYFMYKVVGEGTDILAHKSKGDKLNILGPLGNHFDYTTKYDHLFILGGGIGIAPFPFFIKKLAQDQNYTVLFGVRNKQEVHTYGLDNVKYSSDDGSIGMHGNALDLLKVEFEKIKVENVKIIACGPNPMFRALKKFTENVNVDCDVSMESAMACGFGICQGCPVDVNSDSYKLICKDGPVFNIREVTI